MESMKSNKSWESWNHRSRFRVWGFPTLKDDTHLAIPCSASICYLSLLWYSLCFPSPLFSKSLELLLSVSRQVPSGQVPGGQVPGLGLVCPGTCPPGSCPRGSCPVWFVVWHLSGHHVCQAKLPWLWTAWSQLFLVLLS